MQIKIKFTKWNKYLIMLNRRWRDSGHMRKNSKRSSFPKKLSQICKIVVAKVGNLIVVQMSMTVITEMTTEMTTTANQDWMMKMMMTMTMEMTTRENQKKPKKKLRRKLINKESKTENSLLR